MRGIPLPRYPNFDLGDNQEHKVTVGASCCWEKVTLTATDVAGNENTFEASKWDYGSVNSYGLSPTIMWVLIGVALLIVVVVVVVIVVCCCCKKGNGQGACGSCCYQPVSTQENP